MLHCPVEPSASESCLWLKTVEEASIRLRGGCVVPEGAHCSEDAPGVDRHFEIVVALLLRPGTLLPGDLLRGASQLPGLRATDGWCLEQEQAFLGVDDATHELCRRFRRLCSNQLDTQRRGDGGRRRIRETLHPP